MITVNQVYDAYPARDLLPIAVTADSTLDDVEATCRGDTLFLFLCRELCNPHDPLPTADAVVRLLRAAEDVLQVTKVILRKSPRALSDTNA